MTTDSDRLLKIEQTLAHQDQQIQDLSDIVGQQWQQIGHLKKILSRTTERLESLENPSEDGTITHEVPPHY